MASNGRSGRSPLAYVLIVLIIIFIALACALVYIVSPLFKQEAAPVQQTTEIVGGDDAQQQVGQQQQTEVESVMSENMQTAQQDVEQLVAPYGDSVAVCVKPLDGTRGFSINGDERFVSASMIKLPILASYLQMLDEGQLDGNATYSLKSSDIVGGTGVIQGSSPGSSFTYDQLAKNMIMHSDNTATNILINTMGADVINARIKAIGLEGSQLNRKMMDTASGAENYVTADDCARILSEIENGTLASPSACNSAVSYLKAQTDNEGLAQGLPSSVSFGHKTGTLPTVRHDGGIVYAQNPYVIVVLTKLGESEANSLMRNISEKVYADLEG